MATKLATAILEIHVTVGNPYVRNDYVALNYVEGGIVAQDLDLATVLPIASGTVTVAGVLAPAVIESSVSITSALEVTVYRSGVVDTFNTFILQKETRLNTITAESRVYALQKELRSFNVKPETRTYNLLKETRNFKIKRPKYVGTTRKDTVNV